uniref:NADH dehydrogenase [ubiquinone] iron-sulfur protein 5 n=1 Tax=Macaca fascicularis TaxID=9541 RepID=A0A805PZU4_MACFA
MPFLDIQKRFGLNIDRWWTIQSAEQPYKLAPRCHAFEKEWIECAHGIGAIRAEKECKIEYDDFIECLLRQKTENCLNLGGGGCSEPRSCCCTPAWATEQDSVSKKKSGSCL